MTAYVPQTWTDGVTTVDATHMNYIENGIASAQGTADAAQTLDGQPGNTFCWAVYTAGTPDPPRPSARTDLRCIWIGFPVTAIPTRMLPGDVLLRDNA